MRADEDSVKKTTWQNSPESVGEAGSLTVRTFGPLHHSRASGNLVKVEDGCATVKGYKLPRATVVCVRRTDGKAGARLRPKSGYRFGCARRGSLTPAAGVEPPTSPSKRRMRPARCACAERDSLSAFILRFAGG
jgi:hypothetical protein